LRSEEVAARLLVAGMASGLSEAEARATAASGLRAGLGSPRGVPARGHPGHEVHRRSRELSRRALSPDRGRELDR
ncbi:MAG: hypothetical protein ACRD0J_03650, partial [Acidimicrobiales bacterium]